MDEHIVIRARHRAEFEEAGLEHVKRTLHAGNYSDPEKIKHARAWIDEQEHGEERVYRAEQLRLGARADRRGVVTMWTAIAAIVISLISLYFSLVHASFFGRLVPTTQDRSTPDRAPSPK